MGKPRPRGQAQALHWEGMRCVRCGALLRLFRYRWGHVLPDDDAGRGDLWLLVCNASLAAKDPEKKMRHAIEVWAPWMTPDELAAYVQHVWGLDRYQRLQTAREIGEQIGLTNAEREALKLWPFKPIDKTDDELAEIATARRNQRRREKRTQTRGAYLASLASKPKPWISEGISRSAYYRKRKRDEVRSQVGRGPVLSIVPKVVPNLVPPEKVESQQRGFQGGAMAEDQAIPVTGGGDAEGKASSSSVLVPNPVPPESSPVVLEDRRMAAMKNWGANAKRRKEGTNG